MNITLEEAYREACLALGEQIVERRLLAKAEVMTSAPDLPTGSDQMDQ